MEKPIINDRTNWLYVCNSWVGYCATDALTNRPADKSHRPVAPGRHVGTLCRFPLLLLGEGHTAVAVSRQAEEFIKKIRKYYGLF